MRMVILAFVTLFAAGLSEKVGANESLADTLHVTCIELGKLDQSLDGFVFVPWIGNAEAVAARLCALPMEVVEKLVSTSRSTDRRLSETIADPMFPYAARACHVPELAAKIRTVRGAIRSMISAARRCGSI